MFLDLFIAQPWQKQGWCPVGSDLWRAQGTSRGGCAISKTSFQRSFLQTSIN